MLNKNGKKLKRGALWMGKVSYRPRKGQGRGEEKKKTNKVLQQMQEDRALQEECVLQEEKEVAASFVEPEPFKLMIEDCGVNQEKIQSTKIVGDLGSDYHVYIEDYVYTYIYQFAAADYTKESSAILIGQSYSDSKEVLIKGIIPVAMDKLQKDSEWIDMGIIDEVEENRKKYFEGQQIIGWMHMQPGYGTMLTMKEVREHQSVFEGSGTVCMLVDAINKIETLFIYEDDELKEQSGYCMYYERNEQMQQYMLDHPFSTTAKEEIKDNVVSQFREIGKMRKEEYMQRKNLNLTVMIASVVLIVLTAVIVKMNDGKGKVTADDQVVSSNMVAAPKQNESEIDNELLHQNDEMQLTEGEEGVVLPKQEEAATEEMAVNQEANNENVDENTQAAAKDAKVDEGQTEEASKEEVRSEKAVYDIYVVKAGDTLADICYAHYGSAERSAEVAAFNEMTNTNALYVGEELKMPK